MPSLKQRTLNGALWSFFDNIANTGITFIVGLILARLLSPSEFGILGMIAILLALSNSIIDSGFSQALIRKQNADENDYNTIFIFNLCVSILLCITLFFAAPLVSRFFNEPKLLSVVRVMSSTLILNSLSIIHRTQLIKKINFKSQTKISLIASIVSGVISIILAFYGFKEWSLVLQVVIKQLINSIALWFVSTWRPSFIFSWKSFKELFGFGSKLLLSGLIDTVYKNIYYLVIGRFYTAFLLGQYTRAEQFASMFSSNLTAVVQKVSYPALSTIQQENERLKIAYRKVIKSTMIVTFILMLGLTAIAKPLILLLIGPKWTDVIFILQLLCIAEMLYPLHAININILNIKGRSDLILKLEIIKKCIAVPVIFIGIFWGIRYMLYANIVSSFLAFFLNSYYSSDLLKYSTSEQFFDILPSLLISSVVSGIVLLFSFLNLPHFWILILQLTTGGILTLFLYQIFKVAEFLELKQIAVSYLKKKYE